MEMNTPDRGNFIMVAAKVPPRTMRIPGRLRKIVMSDPVRIARVTTVTPMTSPARVAKSTSKILFFAAAASRRNCSSSAAPIRPAPSSTVRKGAANAANLLIADFFSYIQYTI
jgi:hypothetical protein